MPAPSVPDIDYPNWATEDVDDPVTGLPNAQEPPDTKILNGMDRLEFMPRQWINWLFRSTGRWIQYLRELADFTTAALAEEVSARGTAVTNEATARSEADVGLQNNINAIGGTWNTWTPSPLLEGAFGGAVESVGAASYRYKIIGKTVFLHASLRNVVLSGAPLLLLTTLPDDIAATATSFSNGLGLYTISGDPGLHIVLMSVGVGSNALSFSRPDAAAWPAGAVAFDCDIVFEIN